MTFTQAYAVAKPRTLISENRCRGLWLVAGMTRGIQGDVLELGTFRGGSLYLLGAACPERKVYGVDTFTGMPAMVTPDADGHRAGQFADTSLERVRELVAPLPNVEPVAMKFPSGLTKRSLNGPFSMAHFDGDLLESCRAFLKHVLPRLSVGGAIVFDDFEWKDCPGVKRAIEELGLQVVHATQFQAVYVKRGRRP